MTLQAQIPNSKKLIIKIIIIKINKQRKNNKITNNKNIL